jgi:hypothetical protein
MRRVVLAAVASLFALTLGGDAESAWKQVTWTGWFSDMDCASGRAASGTFTATNPDCARKCIEKGAAAVFISEQAKALFTVKTASVIEELGYHVEVHGRVDETAKVIELEKVTRLGDAGVACARPKKVNF